jgi:hypothetical protein
MADATPSEGFTGRTGEVGIDRFKALSIWVWRRKPEHGICSLKGAVDHLCITVRSLDDLNSVECLLRQLGRIARDYSNALP